MARDNPAACTPNVSILITHFRHTEHWIHDHVCAATVNGTGGSTEGSTGVYVCLHMCMRVCVCVVVYVCVYAYVHLRVCVCMCVCMCVCVVAYECGELGSGQARASVRAVTNFC